MQKKKLNGFHYWCQNTKANQGHDMTLSHCINIFFCLKPSGSNVRKASKDIFAVNVELCARICLKLKLPAFLCYLECVCQQRSISTTAHPLPFVHMQTIYGSLPIWSAWVRTVTNVHAGTTSPGITHGSQSIWLSYVEPSPIILSMLVLPVLETSKKLSFNFFKQIDD